MSNDISKVYQFLSTIGDWKTKADKNGDGTIIKSEFRSFLEDNYEWDGETTDAGKNDLINSFWKAIDTNQSGKISGTRYKNKNALDSTEQEAIQNKIDVYTELETYKLTVLNKVPGNVDAQQWKKSVTEALLTNADAFIAQGGKADGLKAYLDAQINYILNRTTANETAKYSLQQQVPNYNEGNLDNTLNSIISKYIEEHINKLGADEIEKLDMSAVQAEIKKIVDAYVAVSNPDTCTDEAIKTLKDYGYDVESYTSLTDLQKYKLKTQFTTVLADLKNEADYKSNSALYDKAIEEYIDSVLSGASFEDYRTKAIDDKISIEAFKSSEAGKALTKTITVKNMFGGDDLKTALTNKLSEAIANQLSGAMTGVFPAYDEIKTQALEKAQNGDFDDADGNLDINKAIEWVVEQVNNKLTDIFSSNLGKLELSDFATIYDKLANAAKEYDDIAGLRKAAISYCDSVAKRSTKLAEVVKEIFGNTYSTEINKMSNVDIEAKMTELKAKVEEIGDPSTFKVAGWGSLPTEISMATGGSKSYKLESTVTNGASAIATDRISYGYNVKNGNAKVSISDAGALTITAGSINGTSTIEIYAMVDNAKVEPAMIIKVTSKKANFDWGSMTAKYNGYIANGNGGNKTPNSVKTLGELYNSNGVINLLPSEDLMKGTNWTGAVATAKTNVRSFVEMLASNCTATGEYNEKALNTAKQKVIALYETAFDHSLKNWAGKKKTRDNVVEYDGENYGYEVAKYWSNASTRNTDYSAGCSASNNQLGLRISEQYDDHWFQITVNVKCVMDLFNKFYEQALTA